MQAVFEEAHLLGLYLTGGQKRALETHYQIGEPPIFVYNGVAENEVLRCDTSSCEEQFRDDSKSVKDLWDSTFTNETCS